MAIEQQPLFSQVFEDLHDFSPAQEAVYVAQSGVEERSHFKESESNLKECTIVEVLDDEATSVSVSASGRTEIVSLRSAASLAKLWRPFASRQVYLDITGLRHHSWIPLLRAATDVLDKLCVVYIEPREYQPSLNPTEGEIYDLSERSQGISPIPGFASLSRTEDEFYFVPLLGFEGTRVSYLMEHVKPSGDRIIPIIGVPGFRPEYPFATYAGNKNPLRESDCWRQARFADANCPFSAFYLLTTIARDCGNAHLKIAPVGTKPHALGAAIFVLHDPHKRELVYDHPIRKARRTKGRSRLLTYDVSGFLKR